MEAIRLIYACLALVGAMYAWGAVSAEQCDPLRWREEAGDNPFLSRQGKVVLVAMLKGYCRYCIGQATGLENLKNHLMEDGFPDIDMIIINGGEPRSRGLVQNLVNASNLTVIQDTPDHILYRHVFQAFKDDFLVYDRCHQSAIYIPHPYSDLRNTVVSRVLKVVHEGRHSCYCSQDYYEPPPAQVQGDPYNDNEDESRDDSGEERMVGDDPEAYIRRESAYGLRLDCENGGIFCPQSYGQRAQLRRQERRRRFRGRYRGRN